MTFKVLDTKTGEEPNADTVERIARDNGLMPVFLEGFAITEEGQLMLYDKCGNFAYVEEGVFKAEVSNDNQ